MVQFADVLFVQWIARPGRGNTLWVAIKPPLDREECTAHRPDAGTMCVSRQDADRRGVGSGQSILLDHLLVADHRLTVVREVDLAPEVDLDVVHSRVAVLRNHGVWSARPHLHLILLVTEQRGAYERGQEVNPILEWGHRRGRALGQPPPGEIV